MSPGPQVRSRTASSLHSLSLLREVAAKLRKVLASRWAALVLVISYAPLLFFASANLLFAVLEHWSRDWSPMPVTCQQSGDWNIWSCFLPLVLDWSRAIIQAVASWFDLAAGGRSSRDFFLRVSATTLLAVYYLLVPFIVYGDIFPECVSKSDRGVKCRIVNYRRALVGGLIALVAASIFWEWKSVPPGINSDAILYGRAGKEMWENGWNPFYMNSGGLPTFHFVLTGLFLRLIQDQHFGLFLGAALPAMFCPLLIFGVGAIIRGARLGMIGAVVLTCLPFFVYYSRVPTGASLMFSILAFLYGFIRSIYSRGWVGPLLAGCSLAIAQWDYWASRCLVSFFLSALPLLFLYRSKLEKRWHYRLVAVLLIATPFVLFITRMSNFGDRNWSLYLTPDGYYVSTAPVWLHPSAVTELLTPYLGMWFDPEHNSASFHTIPYSLIKPFPYAWLALGGILLSVLRIRVPTSGLLLLFFANGLAASIFSSSEPNGHRMLAAEVVVALFIGIAINSAWEWIRLRPQAGLRRLAVPLVFVLLIVGSVNGLYVAHRSAWSDSRSREATNAPDTERAYRVGEELEKYSVHLFPSPNWAEGFFYQDRNLQSFSLSSWLPSNWEEKPRSNHFSTVDLRKWFWGFLAEDNRYQSCRDAETCYSWGFRAHPRDFFLDSQIAAREWFSSGLLRGGLMVSEPGVLRFECKDCSASVAGVGGEYRGLRSGEVLIFPGLTTLTISSSSRARTFPPNIEAFFQASGSADIRRLDLLQLYNINRGGWYESVLESSDRAELRELMRRHVPGAAVFPYEFALPPHGVRRTYRLSTRLFDALEGGILVLKYSSVSLPRVWINGEIFQPRQCEGDRCTYNLSKLLPACIQIEVDEESRPTSLLVTDVSTKVLPYDLSAPGDC